MLKQIWLRFYMLLIVFVYGNVEAVVYNPHTFTLKNGLQVVVIENHRAPVVTQMVWYKVGSIDDPHGKSGLAHYLEHLMFKGSLASPAGRILPEINRVGGEQNAATSPDYTVYYQVIPKSELELIMSLEAGRMAHLEIEDKYAKPELDVILEERHMRVDNSSTGLFFETVLANFLKHHPMRLPTIGWEHEIKTFTTQDAQNFYNTWYTPNNAILLIAGDVTVEEVKVLAKKYYEVIPVKAKPHPLTIQEPKMAPALQRLEMTSSLIQEPYLLKIFRAPNFKEGSREDFYALQILTELLDKPVTGPIYRELVENQRIATFVQISYPGYTRGPGYLLMFAQPAPGHTVEEVERALNKELEKIIQQGLNASEVEKSKTRLLAQLDYTRDHVLSGSNEIGRALVVGETIAEFESWPHRIKAVTQEQVNATFKLIFNSKSNFTAILRPQK
ncbi:MAG: insulinase family protein [Candidatus Paracaedimonas acanthamoebae]|uniref:Insulinase family protein n=1 Tax=Candidatus Paracaedimonas acanthamoebae TaxID=244581 RepID=A0A8J7TSK0_9PROT|nr:insulinase family protein [Candidatus Paracaedimonas acanthamoebae]